MTIEELKILKESEDKVEFKEAKNQYAYNSSRNSVLGYTVAFANERGGYLVLGLKDAYPHDVCGSKAFEGREGQLEQDVYRDLGIRVTTEVLFDGTKRILIISIPARSIGKPLYFNEVPLMRVGDGLEKMSEKMYLSIIQEQEPDFSSKICKGLTFSELDPLAINILKDKYAEKQKNPGFRTHQDKQALSDLQLIVGDKLTYAALILVGSKQAISKYLPQASAIIEYRKSITQIPHDARIEYRESLFTAIDQIWNYVNQPLSNPIEHFQQGPYILDVPRFNEEVVREAVLNAIAHRNYHLSSSIVLKIYPEKLTAINPGGFPLGVTKENILKVTHTPRNRLLAEIFEKTGLVERSSQGVDKMFLKMLSESKPAPDFSRTDDFQVELDLFGKVQDISFAIFVKEEQAHRDENNKLGVFDLINLDMVRRGFTSDKLDREILEKLLHEHLIDFIGSPASTKLFFTGRYHDISKQPSTVSGYKPQELIILIRCFDSSSAVKMGVFVDAFKDTLSRPKVKYLIEKLCSDGILVTTGKGAGVKYSLAPTFEHEINKEAAVVDYLKSLT